MAALPFRSIMSSKVLTTENSAWSYLNVHLLMQFAALTLMATLRLLSGTRSSRCAQILIPFVIAHRGPQLLPTFRMKCTHQLPARFTPAQCCVSTLILLRFRASPHPRAKANTLSFPPSTLRVLRHRHQPLPARPQGALAGSMNGAVVLHP